MRPVKEGAEAEDQDLISLHRQRKRANLNEERKAALREEVLGMYNRLIEIYTSEQNKRSLRKKPKKRKSSNVVALAPDRKNEGAKHPKSKGPRAKKAA